MWDAYESFDKGDTDAGVMMGLAGISFGVSTVYCILALSEPLGWVAALVGTGFMVLAYMLTDTPLQTLFSNYLLSDHYEKGFPLLANETPMAYNRRILKNKEILTDKDFTDTMMYPTDAQATLLNLIVCPSVALKQEITIKPSPAIKDDYGKPIYIPDIKTVRSVIATFRFAAPFNKQEAINIKGHFCRFGIKSMTRDADIITPVIIPYNDRIEAHFNVVDKEINFNSELIITTCLTISEVNYNYFPSGGRLGTVKYLALKLPLKRCV